LLQILLSTDAALWREISAN